MGTGTVKTTLQFEGPSDLSVGTIRIHGEGEAIADWVATPGNLAFHTENIKPGGYASDIGPAGVAPQSVIFEVIAGQHNQVSLPPFSILSASGSNTSYFDMRSRQTLDRLPPGLLLDAVGKAAASALPSRPPAAPREAATPLRRSTKSSRIAIGLSEETRGRDSFASFRSPARMELFPGRVELDIPDDPQRDPWAARRVRLSTAIENVRIERCLLPLYCGGTRMSVSTPPFAPSDVEIKVTPVDPRARALLRVLDAGSSAEAAAVRQQVLERRIEKDPRAAPDPWLAMLLGLLSVRYPQVFAPLDHGWAASLARHADWAFDSHVIHASQLLAAAREQSAAARGHAVSAVIHCCVKAQVAGSPYYRYTNQLFGEMVDGIAHYLEQEGERISPIDVGRFARVRKRWYRELPLQRGAGASFTWLARDADAVRDRGVLLPNRHPSGRLPAHVTLVVFEGELSAGKLSLRRPRPPRRKPPAPTAGPGAPGLPTETPVFYDLPASGGWKLAGAWLDDPNKGQFGGLSRRDGFSLDARFEAADSPRLVTVILTVTADEGSAIGLDEHACFVLHPSFAPAEVTVSFRAGRAQLRIQAWGGFTVGVRIAAHDVALECDLAQLEGAPRIIRTR